MFELNDHIIIPRDSLALKAKTKDSQQTLILFSNSIFRLK